MGGSYIDDSLHQFFYDLDSVGEMKIKSYHSDSFLGIVDTFHIKEIILSRDEKSYKINVKYEQVMAVDTAFYIVEGKKIVSDSFWVKRKNLKVVVPPYYLFAGRSDAIAWLNSVRGYLSDPEDPDTLEFKRVGKILFKLQQR